MPSKLVVLLRSTNQHIQREVKKVRGGQRLAHTTSLRHADLCCRPKYQVLNGDTFGCLYKEVYLLLSGHPAKMLQLQIYTTGILIQCVMS